ncbi:zf-CCHC domain-containing protein [Tanacetum coccineum]|uniref:Zf-CCHC domain-containing protein n=1 Tax=Tanacetum coccineum TaxID=301880 RepID=A0ABQ5B0V8_9ASTR
MHTGTRSVVEKAIRTGYHWPTMHADARKMTRECQDCQVHRPVPRNPQLKPTPIMSLWPFYKWGIDIVGPFPEEPGDAVVVRLQQELQLPGQNHSRNWYNEATTKERIKGSSDDVDIKQLDENSIKEQAVDDEWIRKFIKNTDSNIRALKTTTKNLQKKTYQLTQTVLTNTSEKVKARTTMGKKNVKESVLHDLPVVQTYVPPTKFLGSPFRTHETVCMMGIPKEIHKMKAYEDEGNTDDAWDITVKNVDRFRQILTPIIHTLPNLEPMVQSYVTRGSVYDKEKVIREKEQDYDIPLQDHVMQPLTPQIVHITPPDDNYVAPATNPILNKHLNEFGEEFANNTKVFEKIDSNPVNDLKELLNTYDFETFIRELLHQLSQ